MGYDENSSPSPKIDPHCRLTNLQTHGVSSAHSQTAFQDTLTSHLAWWGLRRFERDADYFRWQRETLSQGDLRTLNKLVERKQAPAAGATEDVAFYDGTAQPQILPVLHSQQYDYYMAVGPAVAGRIGHARTVLDWGCGVGILTTFYARQFPHASFVGVDRSARSVTAASERAAALGLGNVRFECREAEQAQSGDRYDLVVATHALLQAERDPGIPSRNWQTFERALDPDPQSAFERRTGLDARLAAVTAALAPRGRLIVFEKTRQTARRVPFQRALAARGFTLREPPLPLRYMLVEEVADDGPLYVMGRVTEGSLAHAGLVWDEAPELNAEEEVSRCSGDAASLVWERLPDRAVTREAEWADPRHGSIRVEWGTSQTVLSYLYLTAGQTFRGILVWSQRPGPEVASQVARELEGTKLRGSGLGDLLRATWPAPASQLEVDQTPLYENHTAAAQHVWSWLPCRRVLQGSTSEAPDGRQRHLEHGTVAGLAYLYCANTFDQRQLVMVEPPRASLILRYYEELLQLEEAKAS